MLSKELQDELLKFRSDREWEEYHTPKNLAEAISIEASELLKLYLWKDKFNGIGFIKEEIADIAIYLFYIAEHYKINIDEAVREKIIKNGNKYPIQEAINKW